jgi:hypothetical protein
LSFRNKVGPGREAVERLHAEVTGQTVSRQSLRAFAKGWLELKAPETAPRRAPLRVSHREHGPRLRRLEIDLLEWPGFRWQQGVIRVEPRLSHCVSRHSLGN